MFRQERLGDNEEALRSAMDGQQSSMWTALPGLIKAVNLTAQTVSVQPSIQGVFTAADGTDTPITMPLLVDVPICWPRGGGYALTFPLKVDDEVLVVFASRCIDSWWQSGGTANAPAEARMHDLADGFAIPGPTSQPKKLSGVNANNVQLRDEAGTTFYEVTANGRARVDAVAEIRLRSTAGVVNVSTPTTNVTGDLNVGGDLHVTGSVVLDGECTLGGIIFSTHIHGSSPGPSNP